MKHSKHVSHAAPFTGAVERIQPALDAIPNDQLEPVRHDASDAPVTVLGVLPNVMPYRDQVEKELGDEAAKHFDDLPDAARGCFHLHATGLMERRAITTEPTLDELGRVKHILHCEALTLVAMQKLPASVLAELVGGNGQHALCLDTLQLVAAFRTRWDAVSKSTAVTQDELDQAESLASVLATTLGENEQGTSPVAPTADQRLRAYTYFVRTYDEVRRAIHFIRWDQGDADEIAPSLSAGRTRHQPAEATLPANHGPIVPIVPITSAGTTAAPVTAPATPVAPVAVNTPATPAAGAPNAQPFTS